ncbi:glycerol-3-phosphate dehydrogenase [Methylocystis sp. L43]|uniref:heterodisulfide reductase-related iron-sulfur binding cluster n=1 Tax=unclassified Methylocystis TaxID=2625913 RepID=UPI0018C250F1|nr:MULTISPECIES: heterodisulfide reductase-related iron-sulfur binding cluster [unclassified Methylocystis]MBG0797671.1 glycerol-3-phosphate dehydrogenase [Methylocystis sp. L43]MBG0805277.1 glycerol-3-phosphate dehydrogenase [Methylocystis sp. H15]
MREGSLEAPIRHPLDWRSADFYDDAKLDAEMRRVFDICHTCRRCFNLCDSFPRLFDLIDESKSGELDTVASADFKQVVDACTLCDMCFMSKCPYVPPHEFNIDFPHLILRYRAVEAKKNGVPAVDRALADTDRYGKWATLISGAANWATRRDNATMRGLEEKVAGVDRNAELPKYASKTLEAQAAANPPARDESAPAKARKAVLYATCYGDYNDTSIGMSALAVLARNGVDTKVVHPACCGMPKLEQGMLDDVAEAARKVAAAFAPYIDAGYDIVAPVPSCALMLKFEWPLILPEEESVKRLAEATFDLSEYVVDIARKEGLAEGMAPLDGGVAFHVSCHSRAQNIGQKGAELLALIPEADVAVVERCSGHGGAWGYKKGNFETAMKVGKPAARQLQNADKKHVVSECPLAGLHIEQEIETLGGESPKPERVGHPIVLMARAYGLSNP